MTDERESLDPRLGALSEELHTDLRSLARRTLGRGDSRLDPTDLVHTAWLRISERLEGLPRTDFLALCATIMRHIAVDEARRLQLEGLSPERVTLTGLTSREAIPGDGPVDLLNLDKALDRLAEYDARWARIVELRFFGGLTIDCVADVMGLSPRTVDRDWLLARAWLRREFDSIR